MSRELKRTVVTFQYVTISNVILRSAQREREEGKIDRGRGGGRLRVSLLTASLASENLLVLQVWHLSTRNISSFKIVLIHLLNAYNYYGGEKAGPPYLLV